MTSPVFFSLRNLRVFNKAALFPPSADAVTDVAEHLEKRAGPDVCGRTQKWPVRAITAK